MTTSQFDLIVVGAGPAGMAAAATASEGGLSVAIVDAGAGYGGQYWRQPAGSEAAQHTASAPDSTATGHLYHDLDIFAALREKLTAASQLGRLGTFFAHSVWAIAATDSGFTVRTTRTTTTIGGHAAAPALDAKAVVLATGAYDRQIPFAGWTLPGVMTAGGLQALLKGNRVTAGRRIAIGGTGPLLVAVAAGLAEAGAEVVGVFEAASGAGWIRHLRSVAGVPSKIVEGSGYAWSLLHHRVPYHPRTRIIKAHGETEVRAITVAHLDPTGQPLTGSEQRYDVDAVGTGWGFTPQLELAVSLGCQTKDDGDGSLIVDAGPGQRSTVARVYVAGEVAGIGGAALAVHEGIQAGQAACEDLGFPTPISTKHANKIGKRAARQRRFATAIQTVYPAPRAWAGTLDDDVLICRCEEVSYAAVRTAILDDGAQDSRQIKQLTRTGMGLCQARICGYATDCLAADLRGAALRPQPPERPIATPVRLGALDPNAHHRCREVPGNQRKETK